MLIGRGASVLPVRVAPADYYTKLLLHFDGSSGGTSTTDSSYSNHAVTWALNDGTYPNLSTTQKKFGTTSTRIVYDTTNGSAWSLPNSSDFDFGTSDFTIDFWFRIQYKKTQNIFWMYHNPAGSTDCRINLTAGLSFQFYYYIGLSMKCNFAYDFTSTDLGQNAYAANTWFHVAWVRNGNTCHLFIDGVDVSGSTGFVTYTAFGAGALDISASGLTPYTGDHPDYLNSMTGYIDEFRISKGIARWTSDFTPPTNAYSPD